ncbi:hypothetical protein AB0346_00360 [Nocardia beijingensis]|uniref:hypothetical protein n=1 Tax=Nocardia beijingensis TaxID=95162 RepID=UPI00344B9829
MDVLRMRIFHAMNATPCGLLVRTKKFNPHEPNLQEWLHQFAEWFEELGKVLTKVGKDSVARDQELLELRRQRTAIRTFRMIPIRKTL